MKILSKPGIALLGISGRKKKTEYHPWGCPSGRGRPLRSIEQRSTPLKGGIMMYPAVGMVVCFGRSEVYALWLGPISGPTMG